MTWPQQQQCDECGGTGGGTGGGTVSSVERGTTCRITCRSHKVHVWGHLMGCFFIFIMLQW